MKKASKFRSWQLTGLGDANADVRIARSADDVWGVVGVIPQKAFLFGGTVASNLRFGDGDARHLLTRGGGITDYCRNLQ